jgi:hypothetical protein
VNIIYNNNNNNNQWGTVMTDATLGIKFGKVRAASAQHPVDVNPDTWTKHIPMKLMSIPEAITRGDLVAEG